MARQKRKPMSDMNVVPYIDVMLVLLIIFMVTAPMLSQGVKIELPQIDSSPTDIQSDAEPLIVSVDYNGAYYIETGDDPGKPKTLDALENDVSKILAAQPQTDVLVRGDKNVAYGVVVELMAMLQASGATRVGLVTENP